MKPTTVAPTNLFARHPFGMIVLPLLVLPLFLVACPKTEPEKIKLEGGFKLVYDQVEKCYPAQIEGWLGDNKGIDISTIKYEYDFQDGAAKISKNLNNQHSYVTAGLRIVKARAFVPNQTEAALETTLRLNVTETNKECTYVVGLNNVQIANVISAGPSAVRSLANSLLSRAAVTVAGKKSNANKLSPQAIPGNLQGEVMHTYSKIFNGFSAALTPEVANQLEAMQEVNSVELNSYYKLAADGVPWNLDRIDQHSAALSQSFEPIGTGAGVDVYVVDSGVRETHEQLLGRIKGGFNAISKDGSGGTNDLLGHGTHVAGIIAGRSVGVAREANIIPVKVTDTTTLPKDALLHALDWIATQHVSGKTAIINLSLSSSNAPTEEKTESDLKLDTLVNDGFLVTVAAGNNSNNACLFSPAKLGGRLGVIAVGASSLGDLISPTSNYGNCVDMYAPGVAVKSAGITSDQDYELLSGTSMAAPHVAGAAAIYLQGTPAATPEQVEQAIIDNATTNALQEFTSAQQSASTYNRLLFIDQNLSKPSITVSMNPTEAVMAPGQSQQFVATVSNVSAGANDGVSWEFAGGTVQASGNTINFVAPSSAGTYRLRAISNMDKNAFASSVITIMSIRDVLPPSIIIGSPAANIEVSSAAVVVKGNLTDNIGVVSAQYSINGGTKQKLDATTSFEFSANLQEGSNSIQVFAKDAAGNEGNAKIIVSRSRLWTRQFGGAGNDEARGVTVDLAGNVYVSGFVNGKCATNRVCPSVDESDYIWDGFVSKYSPEGERLWYNEIKNNGSTEAWKVVVNTQAEVFVIGNTTGSFLGQTLGGRTDGFVQKYSAEGKVLWTKQFGTTKDDSAFGVTLDAAGNLLIAGSTSGDLGRKNLGTSTVFDTFDAYVMKLDALEGKTIWIKQFGTEASSQGTNFSEQAFGVVVDKYDNILVGGQTNGVLPDGIKTPTGNNNGSPLLGWDWDGFLGKFLPDGSMVSMLQFGTARTDFVWGMALSQTTDSVYLVGSTNGKMQTNLTYDGLRDPFICKMEFYFQVSASSCSQFGTAGDDEGSSGVAVDSKGNVVMVGNTDERQRGAAGGGYDGFVRMYDSHFWSTWTKQIVTSKFDFAENVAIDAVGNIYVVGRTYGDLAATNAGGEDVFIRKYDSAGNSR